MIPLNSKYNLLGPTAHKPTAAVCWSLLEPSGTFLAFCPRSGSHAAETPSLPQPQHSAIAKPGKLLTDSYCRKLPGFPCLDLPTDFDSALRLLHTEALLFLLLHPQPQDAGSLEWMSEVVFHGFGMSSGKTSGPLTPKKPGRTRESPVAECSTFACLQRQTPLWVGGCHQKPSSRKEFGARANCKSLGFIDLNYQY